MRRTPASRAGLPLPPQALPPSLTLGLCFLGCWHCREAVGPLDLVRWALNGQLPYLRLAADSRGALEGFEKVLPLHFLDPQGEPLLRLHGGTGQGVLAWSCWGLKQGEGALRLLLAAQCCAVQPVPPPSLPPLAAGVPTPDRVWDDAVLVASRTGLPCPPLNAGLWLDRWVQELALPQVPRGWAAA